MLKEIRARVISQERGFYRISDGIEEKLAEVSGKYRYQVSTPSDYPAVGDYVVALWPEDSSNAVIESLFPRKSVFIRKAAGSDSREQVVAANIDTVFICMSLNLDFNLRRLERYIAAGWESGAQPVIVLTKADLCPEVAGKVSQAAQVAAGVDILTVSSLHEDFDAVKPYLQPGKTIAFLGSSGVGKSTLINKLLGQEVIATSGIRNDDKGRHTTTHRELISLPGGAFVIDTPGMRELGMWESEEGIEAAFSDVQTLLTRCRFSNCTHRTEPGCAVQAAIRDGTLSSARWESFCKLRQESAYSENTEAFLEAKRNKFKEIAKINKANRRK